MATVPGSLSRFGIGQIVEVDAPYQVRPLSLRKLRNGDRGTIVEVFDNDLFAILWHKNGRKSELAGYELRLCTDPMDAPGRSKGAGDTVRALAAVINVELPHVLEDVTRDLERARMTAEDFRQGNGPCEGARRDGPFGPHLTWREFGEAGEGKCSELVGAMDDAKDNLREAHREYPDPRAMYGHVSHALDILEDVED